MFEPSVSFALANALASCSLRKVSVFLMNPRWPGSRSFGSNETYQVPLDLLGRGSCFISPSPSASTCATWPPQSSTGKHGCGPLPHCGSSASPSPRHLLPTTLVLEGAGLPQAPRADFRPSGLISSPSARARLAGDGNGADPAWIDDGA